MLFLKLHPYPIYPLPSLSLRLIYRHSDRFVTGWVRRRSTSVFLFSSVGHGNPTTYFRPRVPKIPSSIRDHTTIDDGFRLSTYGTEEGMGTEIRRLPLTTDLLHLIFLSGNVCLVLTLPVPVCNGLIRASVC